MNDIPTFIAAAAAAIIIMLAIAAIVMPLFVISISRNLEKTRKTLASMEWMMRNGR